MAFKPLFPLSHTVGWPLWVWVSLSDLIYLTMIGAHHFLGCGWSQMFGGLGVDVCNNDSKLRNLCELRQLCCPAIVAGTKGSKGASMTLLLLTTMKT